MEAKSVCYYHRPGLWSTTFSAPFFQVGSVCYHSRPGVRKASLVPRPSKSSLYATTLGQAHGTRLSAPRPSKSSQHATTLGQADGAQLSSRCLSRSSPCCCFSSFRSTRGQSSISNLASPSSAGLGWISRRASALVFRVDGRCLKSGVINCAGAAQPRGE